MTPAAVAQRGPARAGTQAPRIAHYPSRKLSSRGRVAVEVARSCGLELDPWQEQVLVDSLRVDPVSGTWASFEVGVNCTRQNGKGGILEAREIAGVLEFGEPLIIHSAHLWDTSLEAHRRMIGLLEELGEQSQIKRISRTHGEEGVEFLSGQRIRYRTRSRGGGRGFTSGLIVFDEAMVLARSSHGALIPTLSAQEHSQVWYAGSAVDQELHEHGHVFTRVRARAIEGGDRAKRLAYFEWSLDYDSPAEVPDEVLEDRAAWAQANPALGVRISEHAIEAELDALDARSFAVERLGVGDYPDPDEEQLESPVDPVAFDALRDPDSRVVDPVVLSFDVSPDRTGSIAAAGRRDVDTLLHGEVIESRPGTKWLPGRLLELTQKHDVIGVVFDGYGPAASVAQDVRDAGVFGLEELDSTDHAEACSAFVDLTDEAAYRHRGEYEVTNALRGAKTRPLGDRWAWSRKTSNVNIGPLVALTLALSRARQIPEDAGEVNIW